jgi:hypothetical protein
MLNHSYRVRLKPQTVQHVTASDVQLYGDHLVFVNSNGQLIALFVKDLVRSWKRLPNVLLDAHGSISLLPYDDADPDVPRKLSTS